MLNIQFFNHDRNPNLRNKTRLKTYIFELFKNNNKKLLSYLIIAMCGKTNVKDIQFLGTRTSGYGI